VAVAGDGHVEIPADVAGLEDASDRPGLRVDRIEAVMAGDEDLAHLDDGGERGEGKQDRADEGKHAGLVSMRAARDPLVCPRHGDLRFRSGALRIGRMASLLAGRIPDWRRASGLQVRRSGEEASRRDATLT
jgi:hypothetical protein